MQQLDKSPYPMVPVSNNENCDPHFNSDSVQELGSVSSPEHSPVNPHSEGIPPAAVPVLEQTQSIQSEASEVAGRPTRTRTKPMWLQDFVCNNATTSSVILSPDYVSCLTRIDFCAEG
ncbi:hypothetical protein Salat_2735900 [Sesamum alatum]|uniref:Uncharacterized protein n=1 Tax=Sesamum alatum TaxID=300844 RepID=A0AAE1XKQ9_9LAMI|nr:hypothetical protein Salat_2735900 [Sesamum alatum]